MTNNIEIVKGNPDPKEIAVLSAIFTVLGARDLHMSKTIDVWPSSEQDFGMRGPYRVNNQWRTNLRFW